MRRMIGTFNLQAEAGDGDEQHLDRDPTKISWSRNIRRMATSGRLDAFRPDSLRAQALYRPYCRQALFFDPVFNSVPGKNVKYFPTQHHQNLGLALVAPRPGVEFALTMTDALPDLSLFSYSGQFFPRWTYEKLGTTEQDSLLASSADVDEWGYRRVDNITDEILALYRSRFGAQVSTDDVFFYVYGVLHSEQYRTAFAADLKRMLPRIPLAASVADFDAFVAAGRTLSDLHVNYESVDPYPLHEQAPLVGDPWETYQVQKLRWADRTTKKAIVYNGHVTLGDIPADAHRYMLGSRSALEWIIDRYRVKTDKDSGIVNDPNDWCREHGDPRYIVDLIKRVTRVSVDTMRLVDSLPELPL